jgi:mycothiol synthase
MNITILPFRGRDTDRILKLWNAILPLDAIPLDTFESRVLLDENFDPQTFLVARADDVIVGFVLGMHARRMTIGDHDQDGSRCWITAFGVKKTFRKRGVGRNLFESLEKTFSHLGKSECLLSPYAPGYFTPGVEIKEYAGAVTFLRRLGYEDIDNPLSMDASIVLFKLPEEVLVKEKILREKGITIQSYTREYLIPYLQFMEHSMPIDWQRMGRENLRRLTAGRFSPEQLTIAVKNEEVVGYCQFDGSHFGPFGVAGDYQGLGIGTVMLARTLERMRACGHHNAWVMWTDDTAAKVYAKLGFSETRRFAIMRKRLSSYASG